ncbi:anti-sigma factor family protein [Lyngbya aestuarii]|uniref:anti-sigma factor family protein n=1 Tax=Lyngbya aestuarii TaxID=118322 RepID=UPI00403DAF88
MTENFDALQNSEQEATTKEIDSLQRDRFELLSAYIDGEVTAAERYRVQELLANDSDMQCLYARLMKLRQQLQKLPVPPAKASTQEMAQQVFSKIDRRRNRRTIVWGGAAIAALFVSALAVNLPFGQSIQRQFANLPKEEENSELLIIAVNKPVIDIPKTAVAFPEKWAD